MCAFLWHQRTEQVSQLAAIPLGHSWILLLLQEHQQLQFSRAQELFAALPWTLPYRAEKASNTAQSSPCGSLGRGCYFHQEEARVML